MLSEKVFRYPRRITWPLEVICGVIVGWGLLSLTRSLLLLLWQRWPLDAFILHRVPPLADMIAWMARTAPREPSLRGMVPPLLLVLAAMFVALIVRNMFPAVRFSVRGLLVWFADDWVPVPWESIRKLQITDVADGKRFAVLVQTDDQHLTAWHRMYSFAYRWGMKRSFVITSSIEDGEDLLREIMGEIARRGKLGEKLNIKIEEDAFSPLFGTLLSPTSMFRRTKTGAPVFQPVATAATMGASAALTMPSMGGSTATVRTSPAPAPQVSTLR